MGLLSVWCGPAKHWGGTCLKGQVSQEAETVRWRGRESLKHLSLRANAFGAALLRLLRSPWRCSGLGWMGPWASGPGGGSQPMKGLAAESPLRCILNHHIPPFCDLWLILRSRVGGDLCCGHLQVLLHYQNSLQVKAIF